MLDPEEIIKINKEILGNRSKTLTSRHLLDSVFSSYLYYPTLTEQISCIYRSLIKNHCFIDGNKRTATVALLTLCRLHHIEFTKSDDELFDIAVKVASNQFPVIEIEKLLFL